MKIQVVAYNNRKRAFEVKAARKTLQFPYVKVDPQPSANDPIARVFVDQELGREGFTYVLESGKEGDSPQRASAGIQPGSELFAGCAGV